MATLPPLSRHSSSSSSPCSCCPLAGCAPATPPTAPFLAPLARGGPPQRSMIANTALFSRRPPTRWRAYLCGQNLTTLRAGARSEALPVGISSVSASDRTTPLRAPPPARQIVLRCCRDQLFTVRGCSEHPKRALELDGGTAGIFRRERRRPLFCDPVQAFQPGGPELSSYSEDTRSRTSLPRAAS